MVALILTLHLLCPQIHLSTHGAPILCWPHREQLHSHQCTAMAKLHLKSHNGTQPLGVTQPSVLLLDGHGVVQHGKHLLGEWFGVPIARMVQYTPTLPSLPPPTYTLTYTSIIHRETHTHKEDWTLLRLHRRPGVKRKYLPAGM